MAMQDLPDNVRQEVMSLVPSSIFNEIACFVFYDNHPIQRKILDITICTKHGQVIEYYKREKVASVFLRNTFKATDIKLLRNSKCEIFYLVAAGSEVVVLSKVDELKVHQRLINVEYYEVEDAVCRGQACLKIVHKDDAVPVIFDDKFENLGDKAVVLSGLYADDSLPILTELKRKFTWTKYNITCNQKSLEDLKDLRKITAFSIYERYNPNLDDSLFRQQNRQVNDIFKLKSKNPWVKVCSGKVVIVINVVNKNDVSLEDVKVLIHASKKPSMVYTTKLFNRIKFSPFWKESKVQTIPIEVETAIVVVMELSELQYSSRSKVEFNGVISYKKEGEEFLMPFEFVVISFLELMGKQYDVLANDVDEQSILAVLATTEKVDLTMRIIGNKNEPKSFPSIFCTYLQMERVLKVPNAVIHKISPYHLLNGLMIIFSDEQILGTTFSASLYARNKSQVLSFIHYIHESVPYRIIITTKHYRITAKVQPLSTYDEPIPCVTLLSLEYKEYAESVLKQIALILQYVDKCIVEMNDSKSSVVQSKIGVEIDLFAAGLFNFIKFRNKLLEEGLRGIQSLKPLEDPNYLEERRMSLDD